MTHGVPRPASLRALQVQRRQHAGAPRHRQPHQVQLAALRPGARRVPQHLAAPLGRRAARGHPVPPRLRARCALSMYMLGHFRSLAHRYSNVLRSPTPFRHTNDRTTHTTSLSHFFPRKRPMELAPPSARNRLLASSPRAPLLTLLPPPPRWPLPAEPPTLPSSLR